MVGPWLPHHPLTRRGLEGLAWLLVLAGLDALVLEPVLAGFGGSTAAELDTYGPWRGALLLTLWALTLVAIVLDLRAKRRAEPGCLGELHGFSSFLAWMIGVGQITFAVTCGGVVAVAVFTRLGFAAGLAITLPLTLLCFTLQFAAYGAMTSALRGEPSALEGLWAAIEAAIVPTVSRTIAWFGTMICAAASARLFVHDLDLTFGHELLLTALVPFFLLFLPFRAPVILWRQAARSWRTSPQALAIDLAVPYLAAVSTLLPR